VKPPVLVLHANGTNRDREAAWACELAGADPEIVHVKQLLRGERSLDAYRMLVLPGGFSHGDDLGAGKLWAVTLRFSLGEAVEAFVASGRPVLGICNGFQALVKAGLLPGGELPPVTLTRNDSARFECRWVHLRPEAGGHCVFTRALDEPIYCPVAHGEGKLVARDQAALEQVEQAGLVALRYVDADGAAPGYPGNPNGSWRDVAALTNAGGNVLGLMPHPEDHVVAEQHPGVHRGVRGRLGLRLFERGVAYAAQL